MSRVEQIGDATLYLGDCREILPSLDRVDAVVTDPPYGVSFTGKASKHKKHKPSLLYDDSKEYVQTIVLDAIKTCLAICDRALIFPGTRNAQLYPEAREIGGIVCPNGGGMSSWGFSCYHPVLFYGVSPYIAAGKGSRPTCRVIYHPGMHVTGESDIGHPCPKPMSFMEWAVEMATLRHHTALDPFMGSGTTGVACAKLGRKFIGIEIDERYFDIACQRIQKAYDQPDLFIRQPAKPQQEVMAL